MGQTSDCTQDADSVFCRSVYGVRQSNKDVGSGDFTVKLISKILLQSTAAAYLFFSSGQQVGFRRQTIFFEGASWGSAIEYERGPRLGDWHELVLERRRGLLFASW